MSEQLVKLTNVSKSFAGVKALQNVNLTINRGEVCCLAGENGCGKSTLIKIISGVHSPDEGKIEIAGSKYKSLSPIEAIKAGIQVIYQDFSIFPNLTVAENIALSAELTKKQRIVNWKSIYKTAKEALQKIDVKIDLNLKVEDLAVADKQLIAISRALVQKARLIIMDEPTTALTQKEVKSLFGIIRNLKAEGISVLFVSHKLDEVFEICEKINIFRNGKNVIEGNTCEFDKKKLVYYMTGREIEEGFYEIEENSKKNEVLRVEKISQKGGFKDVSFEVRAGEILGITGLLGSGRTSLANALFGIKPVESGKIYVNGKSVKINNVQDAVKNRISYVPEDRLTEGLFIEQSIGRNIVISKINRLLNKYKLVDNKKIQDEIQKWIGQLKIATPSDVLPVKTLSGGNQQRVVLAKWLSTNPLVLILNGPTVGVDIGSKDYIHQIIKALAKEGVGVIIISDDIHEVIHNCNRILIMKKGLIVGEVSAKAVSEGELFQQISDAQYVQGH